MKKILILLTFLGNMLFASSTQTMTVYKSPYCGCCGAWVDIMKSKGIEVTTIKTDRMDEVKYKAGISNENASCHTAFIDGYVIEGHVNYSAIKKLLAEKPNIRGLTVPGMPIGSPGMEQGNTKEAYNILYINHDGTTGVFEKH